jgi:uncharacterized UBP type Zn finger protein
MGLFGGITNLLSKLTRIPPKSPKTEIKNTNDESQSHESELNIPSADSNLTDEESQIPSVYFCRTCGKKFSSERELEMHHSRSGAKDLTFDSNPQVEIIEPEPSIIAAPKISYFKQKSESDSHSTTVDTLIIPDSYISKIPKFSIASYYEQEIEPEITSSSESIFLPPIESEVITPSNISQEVFPKQCMNCPDSKKYTEREIHKCPDCEKWFCGRHYQGHILKKHGSKEYRVTSNEIGHSNTRFPR